MQLKNRIYVSFFGSCKFHPWVEDFDGCITSLILVGFYLQVSFVLKVLV